MKSNTASKRPTPMKGRKIAQIMRAARELFLEHGYTVTTMDGIAERAGVSKATLYSYHRSKEKLFAAIVTSFLDSASPEIMEEVAPGEDLKVTLLRMGRSIVALMLKADDVAAHRMVVAEAVRSPALGELYFEVGPQRLLTHLSHMLKEAMNKGELRRADHRQAAEQFVNLVMGDLHLKALLCVNKKSSSKNQLAVIQSGIDVFLRAYGPVVSNRRVVRRPASARIEVPRKTPTASSRR